MSIYKELDVNTYINALDPVSSYGGSLPLDAVLDAMEQASKRFVRIADLQRRVGERIAEITSNEGAVVLSGVSAGLMVCAAVLITGGDMEKMHVLPDTRGLRNEILYLQAQTGTFNREIECVGARVTVVDACEGQPDALRNAIGEKTCAIFYTAGLVCDALGFEDVMEIAREKNVPVVVNASDQLPPKENLWRFTKAGAAAAVFTGSKALRGPTGSGLVVGKKSLIDAIHAIAPPKHGIGAQAGIGKEEIAGLCVAVEEFMAGDDFAKRIARVERLIRTLRHRVERGGYFVSCPSDPETDRQPYPRLTLKILGGYSAEVLMERLKQPTPSAPSILVGRAPRTACSNGITVNLLLLSDEQVEIVMRRVHECAAELTIAME